MIVFIVFCIFPFSFFFDGSLHINAMKSKEEEEEEHKGRKGPKKLII